MNILPASASHIDRRSRSKYIKRNPVILCKYGHTTRSDLICRIAVSGHPVASDHARLNPSVLHDNARHVITDQRDIDPGPLKFVGGKPCSLQKRTCLICIHVKIHPPLLPEKQRSLPGPVPGCGKRAGITVGKDAVTVFQKGKSILRYRSAHADILLMDLQTFLFQQFQYLSYLFITVPCYDPFHPVQRPAQIHGCRSGGIQILLFLPEFTQETSIILSFDLKCKAVDPISCTDTDGRRSPDFQMIDSIPYILRRRQRKIFCPVGELCLVYDDYAFAVVTETDTLNMGDLVDMIHSRLLIIIRKNSEAPRLQARPRSGPMRITGLEPARRRHQILNLARLPIPPYPLTLF